MNSDKFMKRLNAFKSSRQTIKDVGLKLSQKKFINQSSNGLLKVVMNGNGKLLKLDISNQIINSGDNKKLSNLIITTINDTKDKIHSYISTVLENKLDNL